MTRCLDIDGAAMKAAIYEVAPENLSDRAPLFDPLAHLDRLHWHSDFQYMQVLQTWTATLSLPAFLSSSNTPVVHTPFGDHGLGYAPLAVLFFDGRICPDWEIVQPLGWTGRQILLDPTDTTIRVLEKRWNATGATAPAIDVSIEVRVLGPAEPVVGAPLVEMNPTAGYIQIGQGRFDTRRRYVVQRPDGDLALFSGASHATEINNVGQFVLRRWSTNGTYRDVGGATYGGSYEPTLVRLRI